MLKIKENKHLFFTFLHSAGQKIQKKFDHIIFVNI